MESKKDENRKEIQKVLSDTFAKLLKQHGSTPATRMIIAEYTIGYMGVTYGMHIPQ